MVMRVSRMLSLDIPLAEAKLLLDYASLDDIALRLELLLERILGRLEEEVTDIECGVWAACHCGPARFGY